MKYLEIKIKIINILKEVGCLPSIAVLFTVIFDDLYGSYLAIQYKVSLVLYPRYMLLYMPAIIFRRPSSLH
jgi:hypothetical protein